MKKRSFCLAIAFSFIVGIMFGPLTLILIMKLKAPGDYQQKREAISFFYSTMYALFEGTYNPEEGSVSEAFLEKFEEHKPQLGGKCELFIIDSTPGYYECYVFFPSGDIFNLAIDRRDGRGELKGFYLKNWDILWRETLYRYHTKRDSDQPK